MDNLFIKYVFTTFRDITTEILSNRPIGAFVVRQSQSRSDALALSVHIPYGMVAHYLIQKLIHNNKLYYKIQVCTYVNRLLNRNMKKKILFLYKESNWSDILTWISFFAGFQKDVPKSRFPCDSPFSDARMFTMSINTEPFWYWFRWRKSCKQTAIYIMSMGKFQNRNRKLHLLLQSSGKSKKLLK